MIETNLYNEVLIKPCLENDFDELLIVSGYSTSAMAAHHLNELKNLNSNLRIKLIVGMTKFDGISSANHAGFSNLMNSTFSTQFECSYLYKGAPVHSKLYLWIKDSDPKLAFMGSANYSQQAFSNRRREILTASDPLKGYQYFENLIDDTIYCNDEELQNYIKIYRDSYYRNFIDYFSEESPENIYPESYGIISSKVKVSLLTSVKSIIL